MGASSRAHQCLSRTPTRRMLLQRDVDARGLERVGGRVVLTYRNQLEDRGRAVECGSELAEEARGCVEYRETGRVADRELQGSRIEGDQGARRQRREIDACRAGADQMRRAQVGVAEVDDQSRARIAGEGGGRSAVAPLHDQLW